MPDVRLDIDELLWLQLHLPRAIRQIQDEVKKCIQDQDAQSEFGYTQMELAAKRTLDAVNHAVTQLKEQVFEFPRRIVND